MKSSSEHTDFEALVGIYLSGSATVEEAELLESIVKADPEKKKLYLEIKKSWMLVSASKHKFNTNKAWEKVEFLTINNNREKEKPLYTGLNAGKIWRIAATILLLIVGTYFAYTFYQHREKTLVADNEVIEKKLQDGSKISLNIGANLKYPAKFSKKERRVKLEGEAYFDIANQQERPFVIEALDAEILVLGTSFYVNANKEDQSVEVVVYSGKVAIISPDKKTIELNPGQKGRYEKEKKEIISTENTNPNVISWKTKTLVFENSSLKEVYEIISNTYGVNIAIRDKVLESCKLTATFTDRTVEDVLLIIKETYDLRYVKSEGTIWVLGEGCTNK